MVRDWFVGFPAIGAEFESIVVKVSGRAIEMNGILFGIKIGVFDNGVVVNVQHIVGHSVAESLTTSRVRSNKYIHFLLLWRGQDHVIT